MEKECVKISNVELMTLSPRCSKIVTWIIKNQQDLDRSDNGSITFHYSGQSSLKIEKKDFKNI
jgi:hypothetical protein